MGKEENKGDELSNLTKDELLQLIGETGLDIRKIAKEARAVKEMDLTNNKEKQARKANTPVFKVEIKNWPDLVVSKTTTRTVKTMVIMPSCESFYIKTVTGGRESIDKLDENTYSVFMRDAPNGSIDIGNDFWIKILSSGKLSFSERGLSSLVSIPLLSEMLRQRVVVSLSDRPYDSGYYGSSTIKDCNPVYTLYESHKLLFDKAARLGLHYTNDLRPVFRCLCDMENTFGHDNTVDFITEMIEASLVEPSKFFLNDGRAYYYGRRALDNGVLTPLLELCAFDYKSFKNYVLYDAVRQGHALNIGNFLSIWKDTLEMQKSVYGKIKDKYPKSVALAHDQMSYKCACMKIEIDAIHFNSQVCRASELECKIGDFVFVAPKVKQDFFDEAVAQANCLASYISKFTDGACLIMFMRQAYDPTTSYITLEIRGDQVVQAKRAHNTEPCKDDWEIIHKFENWICEKRSIA